MTTINTAGINPAYPVSGTPTTASVRANFAEIIVQLNNAGSDIDALTSAISGYSTDISVLQAFDATFVNPILDKASPGDIGGTTPGAGTFTDLTITNDFTIAGNLSIGNATFESWDAIWSVLELGGTAAMFAETTPAAGGTLNLSHNAYLSAGWKYLLTDEASLYQQGDGTHKFFVAASGAADTAISWTTALTINNDATSNFGSGIYVPDTAFVGFGDFNTRITGSSSADTLDFYTNAALAVTISNQGNIGVGAAPTTWNGASYALELGQLTTLWNTGSTYLGVNLYENAGIKYRTSTGAGLLQLSTGSSGLSYYAEPSGTLDTEISYNKVFGIDNIGEVEIWSGVLKIQELAMANADTLGWGQIWVRDDNPNTLMFTDDLGNDYPVAGSTVTYSQWNDVTGGITYTANQAVGVDTTTLISDFTTVASALMIGDSAVLTGKNTGTGGWVDIMQNTYYSVTGFVHRYIGSDVVSKYTVGYGGHYWYVAPTGIAGNTVTLTTAMQIDTYAAGYAVVVNPSSYGTNPQLQIYNNSFGWHVTSGSVLTHSSGGQQKFLSQGVSTLTLNNQKVGIGQTTPNANWGNNYDVIDMDDGGLFSYVSVWLGQNVYHNNTNFLYKTTAAASYMQLSSAGDISFHAAPSGTVDTTASFIEPMRVYNTGVVRVQGNPTAAATKLWVYANDAFVSGTMKLEQDGTGDATIWYNITGVQSWSLGVDNSFSQTFKLSPDTDVNGNEFTFKQEGQLLLSPTSIVNWGGNYPAIQLGETGGITCLAGTGLGNEMSIVNNAYRTNTAWKYTISSEEASRFYMANGTFYFQNAATGTEDADISWTTIATIDATGIPSLDGVTLLSDSLTPTSALAVGLSSVLANGDYSIAVGFNAVAQETNCISIGRQTTTGQTSGASVEQRAVALGYNTRAYETDCISIGYNAVSGKSGTSADPQAVAIGPSSLADAGSSTAIGYTANSRGFGSTAIGYLADAREFECIAIGDAQAGQTADGSAEQAAIAIGPNCFAYETRGIAIGDGAVSGQNTTSLDPNAIAIGYLALADQEDAVAIGRGSDARGTSCVGIGDSAQALETSSVAIGINAQTGQSAGGSSYTSGVAIGPNAKGFDVACVAIGSLANAGITADSTNPYAVAVGYSSESFGSGAVAVGANTDAKANGAVAVGQGAFARELNTIAIGDTSQAGQTNDASTEQTAIAIGASTKAYELGCVALGGSATAGKNGTSLDPYAVAVGYAALATADYGVAIGPNAESRGSDSVALGRLADARETHSIAIGSNSRAGTTDEGTGAIDGIAIGYAAVADLDGSIAIGAGATVATANVAVIGGNTKQINDLYIGKGETNGTPIDIGIHPTSALGTNIAGGNLEIAGGRSTGTGVGGSILFQTSEAGGTGTTLNSLTERMSIDQKGNVALGTAALGTTATDGFLYIPTCAGAPTGTPTTKTGRVPLIFDTTNNNLYVYDGSWISVALA